jgi:hypothetical protein
MSEPFDSDIDDAPLELRPQTSLVSFPQVSEEMIASIALGLEDDIITAARHGLSLEAWHELEHQPWFEQAVLTKRAELIKEGVTLKYKARWMAGELLDKTYLMASHHRATFGQVHDALKTVIKLGNLEPKEERASAPGTTFSISIDLGEKSISMTQVTPARAEVVGFTDVTPKE